MTRLVTRSARVGLTKIWTRATGPAATGRIADDPAHGIACGHWTRADQLLAFLKRNVSHLAGAGINLIKRAVSISILLDRVDEALRVGFDARGLICRSHSGAGIGQSGSGPQRAQGSGGRRAAKQV